MPGALAVVSHYARRRKDFYLVSSFFAYTRGCTAATGGAIYVHCSSTGLINNCSGTRVTRLFDDDCVVDNDFSLHLRWPKKLLGPLSFASFILRAL